MSADKIRNYLDKWKIPDFSEKENFTSNLNMTESPEILIHGAKSCVRSAPNSRSVNNSTALEKEKLLNSELKTIIGILSAKIEALQNYCSTQIENSAREKALKAELEQAEDCIRGLRQDLHGHQSSSHESLADMTSRHQNYMELQNSLTTTTTELLTLKTKLDKEAAELRKLKESHEHEISALTQRYENLLIVSSKSEMEIVSTMKEKEVVVSTFRIFRHESAAKLLCLTIKKIVQRICKKSFHKWSTLAIIQTQIIAENKKLLKIQETYEQQTKTQVDSQATRYTQQLHEMQQQRDRIEHSRNAFASKMYHPAFQSKRCSFSQWKKAHTLALKKKVIANDEMLETLNVTNTNLSNNLLLSEQSYIYRMNEIMKSNLISFVHLIFLVLTRRQKRKIAYLFGIWVNNAIHEVEERDKAEKYTQLLHNYEECQHSLQLAIREKDELLLAVVSTRAAAAVSSGNINPKSSTLLPSPPPATTTTTTTSTSTSKYRGGKEGEDAEVYKRLSLQLHQAEKFMSHFATKAIGSILKQSQQRSMYRILMHWRLFVSLQREGRLWDNRWPGLWSMVTRGGGGGGHDREEEKKEGTMSTQDEVEVERPRATGNRIVRGTGVEEEVFRINEEGEEGEEYDGRSYDIGRRSIDSHEYSRKSRNSNSSNIVLTSNINRVSSSSSILIPSKATTHLLLLPSSERNMTRISATATATNTSSSSSFGYEELEQAKKAVVTAGNTTDMSTEIYEDEYFENDDDDEGV